MLRILRRLIGQRVISRLRIFAVVLFLLFFRSQLWCIDLFTICFASSCSGLRTENTWKITLLYFNTSFYFHVANRPSGCRQCQIFLRNLSFLCVNIHEICTIEVFVHAILILQTQQICLNWKVSKVIKTQSEHIEWINASDDDAKI